jgi:DNA-binding XRE family transcriptional regulator/phage repressor protein C with HTH and peptisase S24 domain
MMKLDFSARLRQLRSYLGVGQTEFAQNLDIPRTSLINYEKGTSSPSLDFVASLKKKYHVDTDWFLTGEGTPFVKQGIGASAGFAPYGTLGAGPPGAVLGYKPPLASVEPRANTQPSKGGSVSFPPLTHAKIPLLKQRVSCGAGVNWETEENIDEYIEVQTLIPRLGIGRVFAVKAQGSSMLGAGIRAGDYIFFDGGEEQTPRDGIYVFALDGDVYCKRLEFDNLARRVKIFSVRVADLEKAELITSLDTNDASFADRFFIFGKVTRCIRLIDVGDG